MSNPVRSTTERDAASRADATSPKEAIAEIGLFLSHPGVKGKAKKKGALIKDGVISLAHTFSIDRRITVVRAGVPAHFIASLSEKMGLRKGRLIDVLRLPKSTVARLEKEDKPLSSPSTSSLLGIYDLINITAEMVKDSGGPDDFDAAKWVGEWIESPHPALGAKKPADYLDTPEGLEFIKGLLQQSQTGAYA